MSQTGHIDPLLPLTVPPPPLPVWLSISLQAESAFIITTAKSTSSIPNNLALIEHQFTPKTAG